MTVLDDAELLLQAKNYSGSGDWLDESGNGHDAQPGSTSGADTNDPLFVNYDGFQWVRFPGTSANLIVDAGAPAAADVAAEETATIATWVRTRSDVSTFDSIFSTFNNTSGIRINLSGAVAGRPRLSVHDGTTEVVGDAASAMSQDIWHHVVFTVDHSSGVDEAKIWIDGSQSGSTVDISSSTGTYSADHLAIGSTNSSSGNMAGDLAYVEFYKDLATDAEILTAFRGGVGTGIAGLSGAVSVVDLSDTVALAEPFATLTDPQSNVYTINRASTGLVSTVIDRDQWLYTTNDYHEIADDANLDFAGSEDFTMMVAFRTETVAAGDDVLLAKKDNLTTAAGYALVRSTATGQGIIADGTADDDDIRATVAIHKLHTAAFIRDTTADTIEAFLDADGSGTHRPDSTTATLANALPVRIGATSGTAANFLEGQTVAVALWRRVLSDAELREADGLLTGSIPGAIQIQNV